jgi:hypothetical protein
MMKYLFYASFVCGLVSACGGSSHKDDMTTVTPPVAQAPVDAFTAAVQSNVATAPDDSEPVMVETVVVTTVDDEEPIAIL